MMHMIQTLNHKGLKLGLGSFAFAMLLLGGSVNAQQDAPSAATPKATTLSNQDATQGEGIGKKPTGSKQAFTIRNQKAGTLKTPATKSATDIQAVTLKTAVQNTGTSPASTSSGDNKSGPLTLGGTKAILQK